MIDMYHSRRTNFVKCHYYRRDEKINDLDRYVLEAKPTGCFYAKPFSPKNRHNQDIANTFRFSEHTLTIMTEDDIDDLEENNIVEYRNKTYVVVDIQRENHVRESQYGGEHYTTYIGLRK